MSDWKTLAVSEATRQGVAVDIVLATIDAETGGVNKPGDNGNAVGYGQVWPKWHMNSFESAAKQLGIDISGMSLENLKAFTLSNDAYSMAVAVHCIKGYWEGWGGNWDKFTRSYVGPAIPDSDYQRRLNIWNQYHNSNFDYQSMASSSSQSEIETGFSIAPLDKLYSAQLNTIKNSDILYGRKYRVLVGTSGNYALDVSDLRCTFKTIKTMQLQLNYSEVVIYNLNAETENAIIDEGDRIVVEAGYEGGHYGVVFDGNIILPIREKEDGVTYKLTLIALDGDRFATQGMVGFNIPKGQTSRKVIESCGNRASIPIQFGSISQNLSSNKLTRGKVVFGLARDYLRQIAQSENATFYIEDGKGNIIKAPDLPTGEIIELSPTSGLIGVPEQTQYGARIKCLLNPKIKLNSLVHIDNSLIRANRIQQGQFQQPFDNDGIYRAYQLINTGDTRGNDWYTEIETVTQAGMNPAMIANSSQALW